jgi:transcriptional repressor NrdR
LKCPFCGDQDNKVVDSRVSKDASVIRRRRQCLECSQRFTTYERVEEMETYVIKRDGSREPFDRTKIERGVMLSLRKRPVDLAKVEEFLDKLEGSFAEKNRREMPAREIGEIVLNWLRDLDDVAYVRFASVYRDFGSVDEFMAELRKIRSSQAEAL